MGVWGPAVFDNDLALDVKAGFRELIAASYEPGAAAQRAIEAFELGPDPESAPGWLALAVVQWDTGRVTEEVRAQGLAAARSDDPSFWDEQGLGSRRQAVLKATLNKLSTPPPPPVNVRAPTLARSPYLPGDVVGFRLENGASAAIWAMRNHEHHGLVSTDVNTYFQLVGFWDGDLPDIETITATDPARIQDVGGPPYVLEFTLHRPQYATGEAWETIGTKVFPSHREVGGYRLIQLRSKGKAAAAFDDYLTYCYDHLTRAD
jgi:hypothetical protein